MIVLEHVHYGHMDIVRIFQEPPYGYKSDLVCPR